MFMLCQTSVKMAVLLHKQASDRFHSLLTVDTIVHTRKYLLHGYILGSGAPGTLRHMEQLLLVTSCDSPAGIGASLRTHNGLTNGLMD